MKFPVSGWMWIAPALLLTVPSMSHAQMDFSLDEAETDESADSSESADGSEGAGTDESGPEGVDAEGQAGADFGTGDGDIIGELAAEANKPEQRAEKGPKRTETVEEIYAVQQIYALRINRLELAPSFAFTLNDPYVRRTGLGVALNYWWTNVLALGANFLWYEGLESESDVNFFVRRSTRLAVPLTQWQLGAWLNFTYVPLYGKFAAFRRLIFQWDAYVVGGVGLMRTRPIPVIDPAIREFDYELRVAFNIGLGIRVFITRYLAAFIEFRDYLHLERFENIEVALGDEQREDSSTWFADSPTLRNNATVQVGLTIFFPFRFEYRLPK